MEHREELLAQMFAAAKAQVSAVTSDAPTYKALVTKLLVQAMLRLDEPEIHIQCRAEDASLVTSCIAGAKAQFEAKAAALETASSKTCTLELSSIALEGSLGGVLCSAMGKPPRSKIKCDNTLDARLGLVYEELKPQIRASLFPSSIHEVIVHEAYDSDDEGEPGPDDDM
jgi:V-type H+-transporting ATPase subunit E